LWTGEEEAGDIEQVTEHGKAKVESYMDSMKQRANNLEGVGKGHKRGGGGFGVGRLKSGNLKTISNGLSRGKVIFGETQYTGKK